MSLSRLAVAAILIFVLWRLLAGGGEDVSASDIAPGHDVVIFTAPWCGFCDKARAYLDRRGVDFREIDIEGSSRARRQFNEVGGRGIPLTFIGDERIAGFSAGMYGEALEDL